MKAVVHISDRPDDEIDLEAKDVIVEVDGVRIEIGSSSSHPGCVLVVLVDAEGEDRVWKFPTTSRLRQLGQSARTPR